jgi:ribosomal protein L37AE/L43A
MAFPKVTLAICEYKAPFGKFWIARQGHHPDVMSIINLWPELKGMFEEIPLSAINECPVCKKAMAQILTHNILRCNFCGYQVTEEAYAAYLKAKSDLIKTKSLMEKKKALEDAINNEKAHPSNHSSMPPWKKKMLDELFSVKPTFNYYDQAYRLEFEGVELDPSLWDRDNDAGLL